MLPEGKKIILFDGVCNLCNGAVTFVIRNDKQSQFRFAPLQSEVGKQLAAQYHIDLDTIDSVLLIEPNDNRYYHKSTAALKIAKNLSGAYALLSVFLILPKSIRDIAYDFIARNRYRWFGKKESCMIPTTELKSLFLD